MRQLEKLNIKTLDHLCKQLLCSKKDLMFICHNIESFYEHFPIVVNGKTRPIDHPIGNLLAVQKRLKKVLDRIKLPDYLHGGIKGKNPSTNASCHTKKKIVLNFDLESFFPSVRPWQVYKAFLSIGCSPDVSHYLTQLVIYNGCLPQGAPTSTAIANLVIQPLAYRINTLALNHKSNYSQFVDDGTISGPIYLEKLKPLIEKIIQQESFRSKPGKFKIQHHSKEQTVTGIKVNQGIDIPHSKFTEVLQEIKYLDSNSSQKQILSVKGKIAYIKKHNLSKGRYLENILKNSFI